MPGHIPQRLGPAVLAYLAHRPLKIAVYESVLKNYGVSGLRNPAYAMYFDPEHPAGHSVRFDGRRPSCIYICTVQDGGWSLHPKTAASF